MKNLKKLSYNSSTLDKNLHLDIVRVTENAAISCYPMMGMGDQNGADQLAVNAMRDSLNKLDINGTVVIGEGERDDAPMLYIGERVGNGQGPEVDIALDPLEGTKILSTGGNNSLSVIALTEKGKFLAAPDVYMEKIAIGIDYHEQIIDLDNSVYENLKNISLVKSVPISDLVVVILDRPRHEELIAKVREAGARIQLISDGDVAAIIATSAKNSGVDAYYGIGGAPEGVLAAAALVGFGGQICTKLIFRNDDEKDRAMRMGITDFSKKYYLKDLASGDVMFAATGVTDGSMLRGVRRFEGNIVTHSISIRAASRTVRYIETHRKIF